MSKVLGGEVMKNLVKEIGWSEVGGEDIVIVWYWLGDYVGKIGIIF